LIGIYRRTVAGGIGHLDADDIFWRGVVEKQKEGVGIYTLSVKVFWIGAHRDPRGIRLGEHYCHVQMTSDFSPPD
jgi:hypothetical protein